MSHSLTDSLKARDASASKNLPTEENTKNLPASKKKKSSGKEEKNLPTE